LAVMTSLLTLLCVYDIHKDFKSQTKYRSYTQIEPFALVLTLK